MSLIKQISNLAQHSAVYTISTAIQKLPGFLLLPIYTHPDYISTRSDFSDYALVFTFIAFMYYLYSYGMDAAMLRYFFLGKQDRKTVFSSTFFILFLTSLTTTGLLIVFSPFFAALILKSPDYAPFIRLAGLILFFDGLGNLPYLILRAEEKSVKFTLFKGFRFLLELGFNILFVVILKIGVIGILYTSLTASLINFLVMLPILTRYLTRHIDVSLWKEMVKFGLPFLPHGIAYTTVEMVDRFIIPEILGKDALGLYAANYKFGTVLLLLITAFKNAWQPFFLKISEQHNARQVYSRVLTYFTLGAGFIVILGTFFIEDILTLHLFGKFHLLGQKYWNGIGIIPIILLSYCFYGIYVILTPGFYIETKSKYMIVFTVCGAAVNIGVNILLLPVLYIWGAAFATLFSYMTMAITIYLISNKIFPIPIEWARMGKIFLLIAVSMSVYYLYDLNFWLRILLTLIAIMYGVFWVLQSNERTAVRAQLIKTK